MTIKPSILVAAAIAACSHPDTLVHVEVTGDSSIDTYELRLGSDTAQSQAMPAIDVDVPDRIAGATATLEVWGLASGQEVAYGTAMVKPTLHATTDVMISLGAIDCGAWCAEGSAECTCGASMRGAVYGFAAGCAAGV